MTTGQGIAVCGIWIGAGIMGAAAAMAGGDATVLIFPVALSACAATFFVS